MQRSVTVDFHSRSEAKEPRASARRVRQVCTQPAGQAFKGKEALASEYTDIRHLKPRPSIGAAELLQQSLAYAAVQLDLEVRRELDREDTDLNNTLLHTQEEREDSDVFDVQLQIASMLFAALEHGMSSEVT